jgi:hypothetical protein
MALQLAAYQEERISVEFGNFVYYLFPLFKSDVSPHPHQISLGGGADVSVSSLSVGNFIATVPAS